MINILSITDFGSWLNIGTYYLLIKKDNSCTLLTIITNVLITK